MKRIVWAALALMLLAAGLSLVRHKYLRPVWGNATTPTTLRLEERTVVVDGKRVVCKAAWGAPSGPVTSAFGAGQFRARWATLGSVARIGLPAARVVFEGVNVDDARDLQIVVPRENWDDLAAVVREVVPDAYSVTVVSETRTLDVFVIELRPDRTPSLQAVQTGNGSHQSSKSSLTAQGATMNQLAKALEGIIRMPVFDKTGLSSRYDVDISFDSKKPDALMKQFGDKAGLQITREKQELEILVVRPGKTAR